MKKTLGTSVGPWPSTETRLLDAWRAWLTANPDADADAMLQRLQRIAAEERSLRGTIGIRNVKPE